MLSFSFTKTRSTCRTNTGKMHPVFVFCVLGFMSYGYGYTFGQKNHSRYKRATCDPIYSTITPDHTMCLDDAPNATPALLTEEEQQDMVDQHNNFRAQEEAEGMMKVVWDENIAVVAQKWAQQCYAGHENASKKRATPTLPGVIMGQNVANYYGAGYSYLSATTLWHGEIVDFEYSTGSKNGGVIGHYTQVVLERVTRIGCGRARCVEGDITKEYIVCNYAGGQTSDDTKTPFKLCTTSSCQTQCETRDASGLCDCGGKTCLNGGTLDKTTCTCDCPVIFTGDSCETLSCSTPDKTYCTDTNYCNFQNLVLECPTFCGICPSQCSKTCENGGSQNSIPCLCNCAPGWTGDLCDTPVGPSTCDQVCELPLILDEADCQCIENPICTFIRSNNLCGLAYGQACKCA
ncbi:cysteine-rich venom protein-like [Haliotis rufescens]|uniref:cysteine-rich venom protein-like n=1 Tax=Haliotis rufescens TaxID=6454 RepID=UPI00201F407C|nr:cysteine-rich venom protein-like [Haliotis rufescens]